MQVELISNFDFIAISVVNSFHPSAQRNEGQFLNIELDVERRMQAMVLKERIRIKEFFIDFDKLRKGFVGEAGVSFLLFSYIIIIAVPHVHRNPQLQAH